jgi:hypothetical protein
MRYILAAILFSLCALTASEIDITDIASPDFAGSLPHLDAAAPAKDATPEPSLSILAYAALAFGALLEGRRRSPATILDIHVPRLYSSSKLPDVRWSRIR